MNELARRIKVNNSTVVIGRFSYGLERTKLITYGAKETLIIGHFCSIAADCKIFLGGDHRVDWITTFPFGFQYIDELGPEKYTGHPFSKGGVEIGHDVWIGRGVTIMAGVKIGNGAVIAANSHVVRSVGDFEIHGGNPARPLKNRFDDDIINLLNELKWWELQVENIREIKNILSSPPTCEVLRNLIVRFQNIPRIKWPPDSVEN
jgi:acetyltransferase-like isoleucine patch superfamily enzyme